MPLGGFLSDRLGPRPVVVFGFLLLVAGSLMLAQLSPTTSSGYLILALGLRGFAMGFAMMPSMSAALARIDRRFTSRASSITNTLQRVATALGVAMLVTFLSAQFAPASAQASCNPTQAVVSQAGFAHLGSTDQQVCGNVATQLENVTTGKSVPAANYKPPSGALEFVSSYSNNTLSIAFDRTFFFVAILSAVGLIPAMYLRKPEQAIDPTAAIAAA